jgi:hypothetical protein
VLGAIIRSTGGTVKVQNAVLYNGSQGIPAYAVYCSLASQLTLENNIVSGFNDVNSAYVRVGSVGASGNIVESRHNAYDDFDGALTVPQKFVVWEDGAPIQDLQAFDYAGWKALLNRSGSAIESGSAMGAVELPGDPAVHPLNAEVPSTSIAAGRGRDLSAEFDFDWRNTARSGRAAWDAGAFIVRAS